jgi:putative transposase
MKVSTAHHGPGDQDMTKRRKRHNPEQIVKKLRDADAMLNAGQDEAVVLQTLEVSEGTLARWRKQYGGMKSEEAKRLKQLEDENKQLKEIVADQQLDIKMLKHINEGNW